MSIVMKFVDCVPISLQLAGALILITSFKSVKNIIKDMIDSHAPAFPVLDSDRNIITVSPEKLKKAVENNYYNSFSFWYILMGYLSAVLFGNNASHGLDAMFMVSICTAVFLLVAVMISKYASKKKIKGNGAYPADQVPDGTIVIEYTD